MKRRLLLALLVLTSFCSAAERPNIVILLADDLGWGDVGYHGGKIATPHLDRFAAEGVRLENFHAAPLCSPTRAGLMTGRWPIRYGMGSEVVTPWRQWGLPTTEHTIADMLAKAGYARRGCVGKWHLGHYQRRFLPRQRGFTFFYGHYNGAIDYFTLKREKQRDWHRNEETSPDQGYSTDLIGREAVRFIEDSKPGEPFFLYVPFNAPHTPFQAKEEDIANYKHIAQGSPGKLALTAEPWKLVVVNGIPSQASVAKPTGPPSLELFHLGRDPGEQVNLVTEEPGRATAMLARLRKHYALRLDGIPHFRDGAKDFTAPKDWVIPGEAGPRTD